MEDSFLISQTLAGQKDAFRLLILRHQRSVFRFLGVLGFSGQSAEDLAQEAFLRAFRHLAEFDPSRAKFSTWLFTMVRNLAANEAARAHRRHEERELESVPGLADAAPDPLQQAVASERQQRLREALGRFAPVRCGPCGRREGRGPPGAVFLHCKRRLPLVPARQDYRMMSVP
jgi:RNA polymerase sigma-70 factor (ECF subfamily)